MWEQRSQATQGNIAGSVAAASPDPRAAAQGHPWKTVKILCVAFQVFSSQAEAREMGESLLPRSILVRRAQMVPISTKPLGVPSVPARRGRCPPPALISVSPRREQRVCDTKFELSGNPRALLTDCLLRAIMVIKSVFRNCKRHVKTHPGSPNSYITRR